MGIFDILIGYYFARKAIGKVTGNKYEPFKLEGEIDVEDYARCGKCYEILQEENLISASKTETRVKCVCGEENIIFKNVEEKDEI